MLYMKPIGDTLNDYTEAKALYYRSFPKNERRSFSELAENRLGNTQVVCFYDDNTFIGFACMLNSFDISHIIYIAVDESLRGHGYGSKALDLLHKSKRGKCIMVDIEVPDMQAKNNEQRIMRKNFYLRAGYVQTSVKYEWRGEKYEILSFPKQISQAEYDRFWEDLKSGK